MTYHLAFSQRAEKHIQSAYEWYEEQRTRLGNNFIDAVDVAFLSIKSNPLLYSFRRKIIRGCVTKNFPYVVLYYVKGNNIRVVSVFHTSKNSPELPEKHIENNS